MRTMMTAAAVLALAVLPSVGSAGAHEPNPRYEPVGTAQERALFRAQRQVELKNYAGAIAEYDKLIAIQPGFASAITERGFAREEINDLAGARQDYDQVLQLAPDRANSWSHACWIRALIGADLDQALTYCDKAVALSASADPLDSRGFVYFRRGEFDSALADYDAVLKLSPRTATTLYVRGVVKRRINAADGDADIAKALKIDPEIAARWARRGVVP